MATIPSLPMADILIHGKPSDREEILGFPITRYDNIVGAPAVVTPDTLKGSAPFQLLKTDTVDISIETIRRMCGNIL